MAAAILPCLTYKVGDKIYNTQNSTTMTKLVEAHQELLSPKIGVKNLFLSPLETYAWP